MTEQRASLEERVVRVAEAALAEHSVVSPVDVLIGLGWLTPQAVDAWRQGRVDDLERLAQANLHKLSAAMAVLRRWAAERGLRPSETAYLSRTRDRRPLRFSRSGDAAIEAAYRTHWVSRSCRRPSSAGSPSARAPLPTWSSSPPWATGSARRAEREVTC